MRLTQINSDARCRQDIWPEGRSNSQRPLGHAGEVARCCRQDRVIVVVAGTVQAASIVRRPKQPYRAPDSQSFFHDGRPLPYVSELLSRRRIGETGLFDANGVSRLVKKCSQGRAVGFADNMAFVGVLSTMLIQDMFVEKRGLPEGS